MARIETKPAETNFITSTSDVLRLASDPSINMSLQEERLCGACRNALLRLIYFKCIQVMLERSARNKLKRACNYVLEN